MAQTGEEAETKVPQPGKVGYEVEVEGEAYLLLLWKDEAVKKELSTLREG